MVHKSLVCWEFHKIAVSIAHLNDDWVGIDASFRVVVGIGLWVLDFFHEFIHEQVVPLEIRLVFIDGLASEFVLFGNQKRDTSALGFQEFKRSLSELGLQLCIEGVFFHFGFVLGLVVFLEKPFGFFLPRIIIPAFFSWFSCFF